MRTALLVLVLLIVGAIAGCIDGPTTSKDGARAKKIGGVAATADAVFPGTYKFDGRYSQVLVDGLYKVLPQEEVFIKSKVDGKDIQFVNWRPDVPEGMRVPVIIQASPYYDDVQRLAGLGLFITDNFVPHGYVYTQLAIRGTGDAGGCDDFRGPNMVRDMHTAIDWLASQPWSNGNVTLIGISYIGTTPWYAAGSGHPAIKTIVPISGSTDAWMVYNRNGSAESRSPGIIAGYLTSSLTLTDRTPQHKTENIPCPETWQAAAAGAYSGVRGDKEPFREFWDERNVKPKVEKNYRGSVFVIHGFEDWNVDPAIVFPWTRDLNLTYGLNVKTLVGQWAHTYPDTGPANTKRWDWAEILLHWFDYWLKGIDTDLGPAVQVQDSLFRWRSDDIWPPTDANWTTLHLGNGGNLVATPGGAGSAMLIPTAADPGGMLRAGGPAAGNLYADFAWEAHDKELKISGLPRVHVTVTPQGPGGYIGAFLYSKDPSGSMKRIGWTSMNLRFHEGGDRPKEVVPGQPIVAKMEIQPMEAAIPAGHQLVLRVWINTPSDRMPTVPPTMVTLNWGGSSRSIVELPLIERGPETYFEPPKP